MGRPKAEVRVAGVRLLDRAVATLRDAGCADVVAVVRVGAEAAGTVTVVNSDPDRGMRSSLELGVDAAERIGCDAIAVGLVDTPGIGPEAFATVVRAWRPGRITVGSYGGRRGHPTVMAPRMWREALSLAAPDTGARELLRTRPELVDDIAVPGDPSDLDTPADLDGFAT